MYIYIYIYIYINRAEKISKGMISKVQSPMKKNMAILESRNYSFGSLFTKLIFVVGMIKPLTWSPPVSVSIAFSPYERDLPYHVDS